MRLGVLGGTFDPPHVGHLVLAESAREALGLQKVLFVPAGDGWRKSERFVTSGEHRLAMVRLAIKGHEGFDVSSVEVERRGPSYTVDTLELLRQQAEELFLIIGEDALGDLRNWREADRIISLARLAVARRPGFETISEEGLEEGLPGISGRLVWVEMPLMEISSTQLRERVWRGLSIRYLVPPAVEDYIRRERLYRVARGSG